jgi:hypothetical protein
MDSNFDQDQVWSASNGKKYSFNQTKCDTGSQTWWLKHLSMLW